MLDGFWSLEVADDRGMEARGAVALRKGRINGIDERTCVSGEYQCQGNLVLGMLDLVLHATDAAGADIAERVQLQIQGSVAAATMAASGTDLAEPGRRFALSLEYRSAWAPAVPGAPAQAGQAAAASWLGATRRSGTVRQLARQPDGRARAAAAQGPDQPGMRGNGLARGGER